MTHRRHDVLQPSALHSRGVSASRGAGVRGPARSGRQRLGARLSEAYYAPKAGGREGSAIPKAEAKYANVSRRRWLSTVLANARARGWAVPRTWQVGGVMKNTMCATQHRPVHPAVTPRLGTHSARS